jgi:hypothetical protein
MEKFRPHWTDIYEILYFIIFRKSAEKIQVSLKSDKNKGYFTRKPTNTLDRNSLSYSKNEKYFRQIERR